MVLKQLCFTSLPESLLEMKIIGPNPRPTESEALERVCVLSNLCFNKLSGSSCRLRRIWEALWSWNSGLESFLTMTTRWLCWWEQTGWWRKFGDQSTELMLFLSSYVEEDDLSADLQKIFFKSSGRNYK